MKTYLISYDLSQPETIKDYSKLSDEIRSFSHWAKLLKSVWLIQTDLSANEIFNKLRLGIDFNDKLLVIEVANHWWAYGLLKEVTDWMKKFMI